VANPLDITGASCTRWRAGDGRFNPFSFDNPRFRAREGDFVGVALH